MKKYILKFLPLRFIKFMMTLFHIRSNFGNLSRFAVLERKIIKNTELNDEEFYQVEKFLMKVPKDFKTYVDLGAGDGINGSCTLQLTKDNEWSGLLVEIDKVNLMQMSYAYRNFDNFNIANIKITPENVEKILDSYNIPKTFGFLNLDIDSYDYEVMEKILVSGYSPYIVSMEINEKFPPPIEFYVKYSPDFKFPGNHFYGCSLTAAKKLFNKHDFKLSHVYGNNAFFLNDKYFSNVLNDDFKSYDLGYKNLANRKQKFPYNSDVDLILKMEKDEAVKYINNLFSEYKDYYLIS